MATTGLLITVYAGETKNITIAVTDANGTPVPLTGYDVRWTAKTPSPIVKDVDDGTITIGTGENSHKASFTLLPSDTSGLDIPGVRGYPWEMRIEAPDGTVSVVAGGELVVRHGIITSMD